MSVTVNADKIEAINVGKNGETVGIKDLAFTGLRDEILATSGASRNWERMTKANPELKVVKFFEEAAVSST